MRRTPVTLVAALLMALLFAPGARAAAPATTGAPSITGSARENQTLTRDAGTWSGTLPMAFSQRWQRCDPTGLECVNLPATGPSYAILAADVGYAMRVVVTASNAEGAAAVASAPTAVVAGTAPSNTVAPVVSGNLREAQVLTAAKGTWTGTPPMTHTYEWRRCDAAGGACAPIDGQTQPTLTLTAADIGSTVRVRVTATNPAGAAAATSAATGVIGRMAPPVLASAPVVSGTARDGSTLSSTTGTWDGAATIAFARRWQRCDPLGVACLDTPETTATYALGPDDVDHTVRLVLTATNPDGAATVTTAPTALVTPAPPAATTAPTVAGAARVGQQLDLTAGTWTGTAPVTFTREWRRCDARGAACVVLDGEDGTAHRLVDADLGHTLRVAVTAANTAGAATSVTGPTAVVGPPQPPVATVAPAVSGTAADGQSLAATKGTWAGAAPLTPVLRWERCDASGASCADTGVATATYKLAGADVGSRIRAVVTATNPDGNAVAASVPTTVVVPVAPKSTSLPTVSGAARDFAVLTGATGAWSGTAPIAYATQWLRCDATGGACVPIPGATALTRTAGAGDLGSTLRLQVTATNGAGAATATATATSAPTAVITAAPPANATLPALTGVARDGQTMTADAGSWTGTQPLTRLYQWRRCSAAGSGCVDIPGATSPTYVLRAPDVGSTVRVRVDAANAAGTASALTAVSLVVAPVPPASTAAPTVSGSPADGSTLTAAPGGWTGTPVLALGYAWERCDPLVACRAIPGATAASYALTSADVGASVRVVVTAVNGGGIATAASEPTAIVAPVAPAATVAPGITGTARDGQVLTAATGTWSGTTPQERRLQWRRCNAQGAACADIAGATGATFVLGPADVGRTLRVVVTSTGPGGEASASSAFTPAVGVAPPANAVAPTVTGIARDGRTLTVVPGDWTGTAPLEMAFRWRRCDATGAKCADIDGAASATYVLTTADVGATVRAVVGATNGGGTASATTAATGVVQGNPPVNLGPPAITGEVVDGRELTAVDGTWTGGVTIGFDHRWWRCDANGRNCGVVAGATGATYRVGAADMGLTIKLEVIARNAGGATSAFSDATPVGTPAAPVAVAVPQLQGRRGVGEQLQATRGTWVGSPTLAYAYRWQRCDADLASCQDVPDASADALRLTDADLAFRMRVRVTVSNAAGSATAVSDATAPVSDDKPELVAAPAVRGDLVADTVPLASTSGTWAGADPLAPSYQWRRCDKAGSACVEVAGATAASYTPRTTDVGSTLRVAVTMDNGIGIASAVSAASAVVAPAPPATTAPPVLTATTLRPGKDVTATSGEWTGAKPIAYALQWLRCDLAGEGCELVPDATTAKYALTGADIGHLLRLRVTATNATSAVTTRSAPVGPVLANPPATAGKPKVTVEAKPHVGSVVRAETGAWTGTDPIVFGYRWQSCSSATACRDVPGAAGAEYAATGEGVGRRLRVVVTAANAAGAGSAESALTDAILGSAPDPAAKPRVGGVMADGRTLRADPGTWLGDGPMSFAYAWLRCTGATCKPVKDAAGETYTLGSEDVGTRVAIKVTATNAYGKADAQSAAGDVVSAVRAKGRRRPTISRLPTVLEPGLELRGRPGTWSGSAPLTFTYQWLRCSSRGKHCRMVKGATAQTYALKAADLRGSALRGSLRLAVTAVNAAGERTALSRAVGVPRAQPPARVAFRGARLRGRVLTVTMTCATGPAPCAGRVLSAGGTASVSVAAGTSRPVVLTLSRSVAVHARLRFIPSVPASGRRVAQRLRLSPQ